METDNAWAQADRVSDQIIDLINRELLAVLAMIKTAPVEGMPAPLVQVFEECLMYTIGKNATMMVPRGCDDDHEFERRLAIAKYLTGVAFREAVEGQDMVTILKAAVALRVVIHEIAAELTSGKSNPAK